MTTVNNAAVSGGNYTTADATDSFSSKEFAEPKKMAGSPLAYLNVEQDAAQKEAENQQLLGKPLLTELMQMSPEARKKVLSTLGNIEAATPNNPQTQVEDSVDVAPVKFEKSSESIQHFIDVEKLFGKNDAVDNQLLGRQLQNFFSNLLPEHSGEVVPSNRMSSANNATDLGNLSEGALPLALQQEKSLGANVQSLGQPLLDAVSNMSSERRSEVVAALHDLAVASKGTEVGKLLDEKLPEVKKDANGKYSIDVLFDLLYALLRKLGEAATARNVNGAKMADIALRQAQASGNNLVGAAQSSLSGSLVSAALGIGIAAGGFGLVNKGTGKQIGNLKSNTTDSVLHANQTKKITSLGKSKDGKTVFPDEDPKLNLGLVKQNGVDPAVTATKVADGHIPNSQHSGITGNERQHLASQMQSAGYMLSPMAMPVSQIATSSFNVDSAEKQASAKVNDSHQEVASSLQRNEELGGQHVVDMIAKLFSLIIQSGQEANQNLSELSLAIKKA